MRVGAGCASNDDAATLSDEALAALVAEFIWLYAEAKQLNERLDTIKEQLKRRGGVTSQAQADRPRFTGPLHPDTSRPRRLRAGALWKHLRHGCASPPLWTGEYGGYRLRVLAIKTTETPPILVLDSEDRHRSEAIAGREMHHQPGRTAW